MSREVHVRFCERPGVKFLRPTHPYIRMSEAFVFLAVVLDGFSRRVVGWAMADHLRAELALSALDMAIGNRYVTTGELIHHSDQGVQYACGDYIARLERAGIQPSMSRAGCPWDNAMAESFMRTLKREEVNGQAYRDRAEAEASILDVHRGGLKPASVAFGAGLSGAGGIRGEAKCVVMPSGVRGGWRIAVSGYDRGSFPMIVPDEIGIFGSVVL